jgi:hypothetical protein
VRRRSNSCAADGSATDDDAAQRNCARIRANAVARRLIARHQILAMQQRALVILAGACLTAASACTQVVADSSACRTLEYKNGSVARAQYLPCAAEMIAALDDLDRYSKAALGGDAQARSQGQASLRQVMALMSAAGGRQLLERWDDRALTDLNVDISNAVTKYQAFYMVRIVDGQFSTQSRSAAEAEYQGANRRYEEARRQFRRLN